MKIYISGAISGLRLADAKNNFEAMEIILRNAGHEPINPIKVGLPEGQEYTWTEYMLADLPYVFECDAIYMLNNWEQSTGARIERNICVEMGKPVYYQASNVPVQLAEAKAA